MDRRVLEKASPTRIQSLFGLFPRALGELLEAVLPVLMARRRQVQERRPDRQRAVGGGRLRRLAPYQEVLLMLVYLRHNRSQVVVGELFGVSADTAENTFHEVILVLQEVCPLSRWEAENHWQKGQPSWQPTEKDRLLIDRFETPIRRPSTDDRQRRTYSGKKKRHPLKTLSPHAYRPGVVAVPLLARQRPRTPALPGTGHASGHPRLDRTPAYMGLDP